MSDRTVEVEWVVDDAKLNAAIGRMEARLRRMQSAYDRAVESLTDPSARGQPVPESVRKRARGVASDYVRAEDRGDRGEAAQERAAEKRREREERAERRREGRELAKDERIASRAVAWESSARNKAFMSDDRAERRRRQEEAAEGKRPSALARGLARGGELLGSLTGGPLGSTISGAARAGGSLLGSGGASIAGAAAGAVGAIVTAAIAVIGAVMEGGQKQLAHTQSLLPLMRSETTTRGIVGGRAASQHDVQSMGMDFARYGIDPSEGASLRATAKRAAGGARGVLDNDVLARAELAGVGAAPIGQFAGLSRRYGISTGSARAAERVAAMSFAAGLEGPEILETVGSGYESLAKRGLNVSGASFEQLMGQAFNNQAFARGGVQSAQGLMQLEGMRGTTRDQIAAPFQELAQSLVTANAYKEAARSGKTGIGFIQELMAVTEDSERTGAATTRELFKQMGPGFDAVLAGSAGGFRQEQAVALMEALPDSELTLPGGKLPDLTGGVFGDFGKIAASDKAQDMRQLGSTEDFAQLLRYNRMMAEGVRSLSDPAGYLANIATSLAGRQ